MVEVDIVKRKVQNIIENNKHNKVTRHSKVESAGLYMLYVDDFSDNTIIPFYIGQTSNFQQRHKQHLTELMSLNRLNQECYEHALLAGLYNGHYRTCKIFSYMINHNCTLNDFHMIVLEEIETEAERLKRENQLINNLYAPFLGFNQINCVTKYIDYHNNILDKNDFSEIIDNDVRNIIRFSQYGYVSFNWFLATDIIGEKRSHDIFSIDDNGNMFREISEYKGRLLKIQSEQSDIKRFLSYECETEAWNVCEDSINEFFSKHRLKSKEKKKLVINVILFEFENQQKLLKEYFDKYSDRINISIIDVLMDKHGDNICVIKNLIASKQKTYSELEGEKLTINRKLYSLLLSKKDYKSHQLKSMYTEHMFPHVTTDENVCMINVEYTCFSKGWNPEICKIDYCIMQDGQITQKSYFIKNTLSDFFESEHVYYYEKGFRSDPFNIYLVGNYGTYIPVAMEYKNGINEDTFRDANFEEHIKVFKEIDSLIDNNTKIIYTTSGHKNSIINYSYDAKKHKVEIIKRLIKLCK